MDWTFSNFVQETMLSGMVICYHLGPYSGGGSVKRTLVENSQLTNNIFSSEGPVGTTPPIASLASGRDKSSDMAPDAICSVRLASTAEDKGLIVDTAQMMR